MDYKRIQSIYDAGYNKNLSKQEGQKQVNQRQEYGFGGSKLGDFIRVEKGSIIIRDNLGVDRVIIGELK